MRRVLLVLIPVTVVAIAAVGVASSLARGSGQADAARASSAFSSYDEVPREPDRRSVYASPVRTVAPTETVDWSARTLDYRLSGPGGNVFAFTVVRRADRLDIRFPLEAEEWHFERNPVSGAHFTGMLVNHRSKRILTFEYADLDSAGVASDWKTAGLLGFDPRVLETTFERTGEREDAFGMRFEHHRALAGSPGQPTDVWWNADELVVRRMVWRSTSGTWTQELTASEPRVDENALRSPLVRHPRYVAVDAVDALESQSCGNANCLPPTVKELMGRLAGNGAMDARRAAASHR